MPRRLLGVDGDAERACAWRQGPGPADGSAPWVLSRGTCPRGLLGTGLVSCPLFPLSLRAGGRPHRGVGGKWRVTGFLSFAVFPMTVPSHDRSTSGIFMTPKTVLTVWLGGAPVVALVFSFTDMTSLLATVWFSSRVFSVPHNLRLGPKSSCCMIHVQ